MSSDFKTILIVDDDPTVRMVTKKHLSAVPEWKLAEVQSGHEAISYCRQHQVDCMLLDLHMPDIDGMTVLQIMRGHDGVQFPILVITSDNSPQQGIKAINLGAEDYVVKGTYNKDFIVQAVRNALEKNRLKLELESRQEAYESLMDAYNQQSDLLKDQKKLQMQFFSKSNESIDKLLANQVQVLLVDDDPDQLILCQGLMQGSDLKVSFIPAMSIKDGLEIYRQGSVDIVLLDHVLPDGSSIDFLREIQTNELLRPVAVMTEHDQSHQLASGNQKERFSAPVVVMTGQGSESIAVNALKLGAQDYINKDALDQSSLSSCIIGAIRQFNLYVQREVAFQKLELSNVELQHEIKKRKKVEIQMRIFKNLVNEAQDFVMVVEPQEGLILEANKSVRRLLGYDLDKIIGKPYFEIDEEMDRAQWGEFIKLALAKNQKKQYEGSFLTQNGLAVKVEVYMQVFDTQGQQYIMVVARDIRHRKALESRLMAMSMTDGLTRIFNRRYFERQLKKEWRSLMRTSSPLTLLMLDVDHFKRYNDTYGHIEGDHCLRTIARMMQENLRRPMDFAARFGGEEFVAVLPSTGAEGGKLVADNIVKALSEKALPHSSSDVAPHVTVSIGVATIIPTENQEIEGFLELVDQALYQAKEEGRNRISIMRAD